MSTHHDCEHGKAYWQHCDKCPPKTTMSEELLPCPGAENFICFLIDTAEGSTISEEYLQSKYVDFLRSHYNTRPDSKPYKFDTHWDALKCHKDQMGLYYDAGAFSAGFNAAREREK